MENYRTRLTDCCRIMNFQGTDSIPPIMSQTLSAFDTSKSYTLTFYYDLHSIVQSTGCTLSVTLGDATIYTKTLTSNDDPRPYNWKGPVTSTPITPSSREEALSFKYECVVNGSPSNTYSYIFIDDVSLVSN